MSPHRGHQRTCGKSCGFTLFELLIVILIIGLISALVIPKMAASLPGVQLKSTTRAVAASLRYARSKAVFESTPYIAIFDRTQRILAVKPIERPIDASEMDRFRVILKPSELKRVYELPEGIEFGDLNNNDADEDTDQFPILFFPGGDTTGGKIVLKNLRLKQYTITVDTITGTVKIERL